MRIPAILGEVGDQGAWSEGSRCRRTFNELTFQVTMRAPVA